MNVVEPTMTGLKHVAVLRQYCDYVEEHLCNVGKAWMILQKAIPQEKVIWDDFDFWATHRMVEQHDASKLSAEEFVQYADWFFGKYGRHYNLRNDGGKWDQLHTEAKAAFDKAWEHHKSKNAHHWQNWTNAGEAFPGGAACHVVCMVADWMAMSMTFGGTAEEYYNREAERMSLPDWAVSFLQRIFAALEAAQAGEDPRCSHCGAGDDNHHSFTCPTGLHPDKQAAQAGGGAIERGHDPHPIQMVEDLRRRACPLQAVDH